MDIRRAALALLGITRDDEGDGVRPHVVFMGALDDESATNTLAEVDVRVTAAADHAERIAREWVSAHKPYCALAWVVSAEHEVRSWYWAADRYGSADLWAARGDDYRRLPGESYAETYLSAHQPGDSTVARLAVLTAADSLTVDRAVAAADVLSVMAPHLGGIQPADIASYTPPGGLNVWRLPPGETPSGQSTLAQGDGRLDRVREIMGAPAYSQSARPGAGLTIAVLDTGVQRGHPAFGGATVRAIDTTGEGGADQDYHGHGTWVCGAIGGCDVSTGEDGYRGMAAGCSVLAIKVLTRAGWGTDAMIARGIEIAISARVDGISMSLGGGGDMPRTLAALRLAEQAGIPVTAAAGNDGPGEGTVGYPGRYSLVECVGALTLASPPAVARFSSRGPEVDVVAPGEMVYGPWAGSRYTRVSGTSMATPLVAAARALCRAERLRHPEDERCPLRLADQAVYQTARHLPGWADRPTWYGEGVVDVAAAVEMVRAACGPVTPPPPPPPPPPESVVSWILPPDTTASHTVAALTGAVGYVHSLLSSGRRVTITVRPSEGGE